MHMAFFTNGDGCAILGAQAILNISEFYEIGWKRAIDYTALAKLRWVDKLSTESIAAELQMGRTAVVRHLGIIRKNNGLISDRRVRALIHRRRSKFI